MSRVLFVTVFVIAAILLCGVDDAAGRKCVCTSKACRESGAKTCRTRFSCYTELIVSGEPTGVKTTRGCTEIKLATENFHISVSPRSNAALN
ncbi:uncharacterized protein LOC103315790 [Nasonia vitripennis]|uniref:Uncharacterized protein n=1 Tax=Nasonia vitripennis TaxID=7425 RepID=A0A7M7TCX6_NASVI|nr:uncharacterized protein LOC103315790 [Nasonia vitripennis]